MTMYLIAGAVVFLIVAVNWVERGAVAKVEAARIIKAMDVKEKSLQDVLSMSGEEVAEYRQDLASAEGEISELRRQLAERPEVAPTDEYCVPGCKPRWGKQPE